MTTFILYFTDQAPNNAESVTSPLPPPYPEIKSPPSANVVPVSISSPSGFVNGRPPGSFALPGIHSVAAAARSKAAASPRPPGAGGGQPGNHQLPVDSGFTSGTSGHEQNLSEMNPSGATTTQIRNIYSPDANVQSPLNGGLVPPGGFLPPPPEKASPTLKNDRPNTLGSVIGVNPTINNNNNPAGVTTKGKKTRWLLCYPSGGTTGASSESPSPPHEEAPRVDSNASTPSPTDGGLKIPNSQSTERPTSLPVALLNSSQRNGKFFEFTKRIHTLYMVIDDTPVSTFFFEVDLRENHLCYTNK